MGRRQLIQLREGTPAEWAAANPILARGEPGWDGAALVIGDGATAKADLAPVAGAGAFASGGLFPIAEVTLEANAPSIDFQGIPADYKHLHIVGQCRSVKAAATNEAMLLTVNNDAVDANYRYEIRQTAAAATVSIENTGGANARAAVTLTAALSGAGDFAPFIIDIPNYASVVMTKAMAFVNHAMMARTATNILLREGVQHWLSLAAINRLTFAPLANNFLAGSTIGIYGVKPAIPL